MSHGNLTRSPQRGYGLLKQACNNADYPQMKTSKGWTNVYVKQIFIYHKNYTLIYLSDFIGFVSN